MCTVRDNVHPLKSTEEQDRMDRALALFGKYFQAFWVLPGCGESQECCR